MWKTIGHEWAIALLQRAIAGGHLAHAYLLTGPSHTGKATLASDLAVALLCMDQQPPCGACWACVRVAQGSHPDFSLVQPDNGKIKIDQIRRLQRELVLSPYQGSTTPDVPRMVGRVALLTEFQTATPEAANALLKILEEPPGRVILLLTATDASLVLPTIVSRCQLLPLRALSARRIEEALVQRWAVQRDRAQLLAQLAAGRMGWAISAVEDSSILAQRQQVLETLLKVLPQGRAARLQVAERLSRHQDLESILQLWQSWWRDVVLIVAGCEDMVVNLDYLESLRKHARGQNLAAAHRALRGLEGALQQIGQNVNARLALEVLLLSWPQVGPDGLPRAA